VHQFLTTNRSAFIRRINAHQVVDSGAEPQVIA
jgi:hypothetical protein